MNCADCGDELDPAAGRRCAGCARVVHAACWERAGGCGWFACPDARAYRRWLVGYLDKQLCADLAVVSWVPCFLAAGVTGGVVSGAVGRTALAASGVFGAVLAVPVAAVLIKRARLRAESVAVGTIVALARQRYERRTSLFARHRARVAQVEDWVTNPVLFLAIAGAGVASWRAGSFAGGAVAAWLAWVAQGLYLGPSRRALENPVRDFPRLEQDVRGFGAATVVGRDDGALVVGS